MGFVKDAFESITGKTGADAAEKASGQQLAHQQQALDYMMAQEEIPTQFREGGLTKLGGLYGLEGGEGSQQELIDYAKASPLYGALQGTRDAGEQAILRNAAATGGLRSGNVQNAMYDYNQRLDERSLLNAYQDQLSGLQGLAGLGNNTNAIGSQMNNMGQTLAQGTMGQAASEQGAWGSLLNAGTMLGASGAFSGLGGAIAGMFSDRLLKDNVTPVGEINGLTLYRWDWNDKAADMGLEGESTGFMADEVERVMPEAIGERGGYKSVNYDMVMGTAA